MSPWNVNPRQSVTRTQPVLPMADDRSGCGGSAIPAMGCVGLRRGSTKSADADV